MEYKNNIVKVPIEIPQDIISRSLINNYSTNISISSINLEETSINVIIPEDIQYIDQKIFSLNGLPSNMIISTISVTGKINCKINLDNINKYVKLSNDYIISIKYAGKFRYLESRKSKAKKKDLKCFENQLTMEIRVSHNKQINIKLFKNGSFQMTGCKSINDCNIVLNKLISRLKNKIAIYDSTTNKIVEKPFIEDIDNGNSEEVKVYGFKIDMINSNFSVNYLINREILYNILLNNKVNCRYEPCIHACVNIKYSIENDPNNKIVSIFVFQSGNIIITGAKNKDQIYKAYDYIMGVLNENYNKIVKKDLINMLDNNDIKEILAELETLNTDNIISEEQDNIII
jgi:TATA-box binding protein (TBP) (component of TFIID and TFIIIB)